MRVALILTVAAVLFLVAGNPDVARTCAAGALIWAGWKATYNGLLRAGETVPDVNEPGGQP